MFDYTIKRLFGTDVKVIQNCCNREDMSCCGGGGGCCKSLFLHTNNYCNSNCFFCIAEKGDREISDFKKLEKVITELVSKDVISKIVLTGGEPTMHPRFLDFLTLLDKYDIRYYSLNTNGILLFYKYLDQVKASKLKYINISMHHYDDFVNRKIMGKSLFFDDIGFIREELPDIEIRLACTITKYLHTKQDIEKYISKAKSINVNNVIFRNEYKGFNKYLTEFRKIFDNLYSADICNCGHKIINGVDSEYRESNVSLKQRICDANLYFRDFIYKDDDVLSGSWEYNSQVIC